MALLIAAQALRPDAMVVLRNTDYDECRWWRVFAASSHVSIVLVSEEHHERVATSVGASALLDWERWPMIGNVVVELLDAGPEA